MAVNDNIRNALESYGGFSINERVYNYLGSLGYTGAISDRLAKYSYEDKKGWQALVARYGAGGMDELASLIGALFGNGEQGAMFVPQPTVLGQQVMYQEYKGVTPAGADGDPVGLVLDPSRKLELGMERVTDPGFDAPEDWSQIISGTNWTVANGVATSDGTSGFLDNTAAPKMTTGAWYETEMEILTITAGSLRMPYDGAGANSVDKTDPGVYRGLFRATSSTYSCLLYGDNFAGTVGRVSLRELPGNHATQSVSADRPLYRTDGTLHWAQHDQAGDSLVADLPDLGTNATMAYANERGVTILEGQTISGDTTIPQEVELYGAIYLDRPFTTSEATKVTDYFNKLRGA